MNAKLKVKDLLANGLTGCQIVSQMYKEDFFLNDIILALFFTGFVTFMQPFHQGDKEMILHVSNTPVTGMLATIANYPLETPPCIGLPIPQ